MNSDSLLDSDLQRQLAEVFQTEANERIAQLRTLLTGLASRSLGADAALKEAKREAHNLKGSAATVGAEQISAVAQKIEQQVVALIGTDTYPSIIALAALKMNVDELARLVGDSATAR